MAGVRPPVDLEAFKKDLEEISRLIGEAAKLAAETASRYPPEYLEKLKRQ